jgi:hypothetical protein
MATLWQARKTMALGEFQVEKGQVLSQTMVDAIPPGRFGSLVRVGYLQEVTPGQVKTSTKRAPARAPEPEPATDTDESEE